MIIDLRWLVAHLSNECQLLLADLEVPECGVKQAHSIRLQTLLDQVTLITV